jgi:hypothetical protein
MIRYLALLGGLLVSAPAAAQTPVFSKVQVLAGSGDFTVPANVYQMRVSQCGGGGGGGGAAAAISSATGGTSGAWVVYDQVVTPGQVIAYIVGAAGAGAVAGNNNGGSGGPTTFGSVVVQAGLGGTGSASGNAVALSPSALRVRLTLRTNSTTHRYLNSGIIGNGEAQPLTGSVGGSPFNGVGLGGLGVTNATGGDGTGFCAGGAGGNNAAGTTDQAGGAGSAGTIILSY